jgi:two-component system, NarL family, sensor kinase
MMRNTFTCICIILTITAHAQNKEADILSKISSETSSKEKADLYNTLALQFATSDSTKTFQYSDKALAISLTEKYDKGRADALFARGNFFVEKNKYVQADECINEAKEVYKIEKNKKSEILCTLLQVKMLTNKGSKKECLPILEKAKIDAEKLGDKNVLASIYKYFGSLYDDLGEKEKSMDAHLKALQAFEDAKDEIGIAMSYNNLGKISFQNKNYPTAKYYLNKGIVLCTSLKNYLDLGKCQLNLGNVHVELQQFDSGTFYYKQAEVSFENIHFIKGLQTANNNIGALLLRQKKYKEAIPFLEKALSLAINNNNIVGLPLIQSNLGYSNAFLGNEMDAKKWFSQALITANKYNDRSIIAEVLFRTAEYDSIIGDFKAAYDHKSRSYRIKDSLLNEKNAKAISELQTKYESSKKDKQIQEQEYKIKRQKAIAFSSLLFTFLSILLGYSFYKRYKLKQEKRLQDEVIIQQNLATQGILKAEENERQRIARELHDGVGQVMSAAKMNLSAFEDELIFKDDHQKIAFEKVINLIDEGCKEVRNVSHQMMPNALLKSGLASAIKEFIDKIDNNIIKVSLHSEGLQVRLDDNTELVLYRIIQECVNNVIKHSGANKLDISLIKDADGISATIEDNGRGFNVNDRANFDGIGLKNIQSRIEYLKGTVDFDSSEGNGTLVAVHVPTK